MAAIVEYLYELAAALRDLDADDPHVFELEAHVQSSGSRWIFACCLNTNVFATRCARFLDGALDDDLRDGARFCPGVFQDYETNIRWHRILHKQGWIAPSWPKQYGGTGWDLMQRHIWTTEASLAGAPGVAPMGLGMCGPMLIGHGTPEQRAFYLPRILSGEDYWCQGYSEPGAGSDLAALKLRADIDGEHYVLERHEDLDHARALREPHVLSRAHRLHRQAATRHHVPAARYGQHPASASSRSCSCPASTK